MILINKLGHLQVQLTAFNIRGVDIHRLNVIKTVRMCLCFFFFPLESLLFRGGGIKFLKLVLGLLLFLKCFIIRSADITS